MITKNPWDHDIILLALCNNTGIAAIRERAMKIKHTTQQYHSDHPCPLKKNPIEFEGKPSYWVADDEETTIVAEIDTSLVRKTAVFPEEDHDEGETIPGSIDSALWRFKEKEDDHDEGLTIPGSIDSALWRFKDEEEDTSCIILLNSTAIEMEEISPQPSKAHHEEQERQHSPNNKAKLLQNHLDEADFYLKHNLFTDAVDVINMARKHSPNDPKLLAKLAIIEQRRLGDSTKLIGTNEMDEAQEAMSYLGYEGETTKLGTAELSILRAVDTKAKQKTVSRAQQSDEESDSHCDVGLSHWRAKRFNQAIREYKLAMGAKKNRVLCHMMIGLCHRDKNDRAAAIRHFKCGLHEDRIMPDEAIALYFELGHTYELITDLDEALYYYAKVERQNPQFRDIEKRVARLAESFTPKQKKSGNTDKTLLPPIPSLTKTNPSGRRNHSEPPNLRKSEDKKETVVSPIRQTNFNILQRR